MAINRFLQSSVQSGLPKFDSVWDGRTGVGAMEPISSITLTTSQAFLEFNNIPQTYSHLQLRSMARTDRNDDSGYIILRFNNDASTNYSYRTLAANGSITVSASYATNSSIGLSYPAASASGSNVFGILLTDILDYSNTNKYKTLRSNSGIERNGNGWVWFQGGTWRSNSAITSIQFVPGESTTGFQQYTTFTLYGIK